MTTETLPLWIAAERDKAMRQVEENAGPCFKARAMRFVADYLRKHGETPGEDITDAMWAAGIQAHDRRAMGPVLMQLLRDGIIEKCGTCVRKRGHGTGGGSVYRLNEQAHAQG